MNTATNILPMGQLLAFPTREIKPTRTNSPLKSNGQPKATPADPIKEEIKLRELQQYFQTQGNLRNELLFTLGLSFAIRGGDLLSLTLGHVYCPDGTPKDNFKLYEDKTNKRNTIDVNGKCQDLLSRYYQERKDNFSLTDPLFISREKNPDGTPRPLSLRQLNRILGAAAKAVGIDSHISSHSLRKTFGYQAMKQSNYSQDTLYALQYIFNHSDIRVTYIYTGLEQEKAKGVREMVSNLLD